MIWVVLDRVLGARAVRWGGVDRRVYGDQAETVCMYSVGKPDVVAARPEPLRAGCGGLRVVLATGGPPL